MTNLTESAICQPAPEANRQTATFEDADWKVHMIKVAGRDQAAREAINLAHEELDALGWLPAIAITDFQMQAIALSYQEEPSYRAITCFSPLCCGLPCVVTLGWVAPADRNSSKAALGIMLLEQMARKAGCTGIVMGIHKDNDACLAMAAKLKFLPETINVAKQFAPVDPTGSSAPHLINPPSTLLA